MIRRLLFEFVLPLLLFLVVRSWFHGSSSSSPSRRERPDDRVSPGGDLKKDPVCGTYVATAASFSRQVGGETFYFCSAECRDRFKG